MLLVGGFERPEEPMSVSGWGSRVCVGLLAAADVAGLVYLSARMLAG